MENFCHYEQLPTGHPEFISGSQLNGQLETEMLKRVQHDMNFKKAGFTLAEVFLSPFTKSLKTGFTLAEVLITLGIIGVVAAMTLPTLIQKHQERVTVNKVKKFYSVMSQAQLLAIKDHGYMDEWNVSDVVTAESTTDLMNYIKPYLKIAKDCGTESGCLKYSEEYVKCLDKTNHSTNYETDNRYYKVILNDGTYMWLRSTTQYCKTEDAGIPDTCGAIWIDVNGKNPPNTVGRDIFYFLLTKNSLKSNANDNCNLNSGGWSCSTYILEKGNMDYLRQ